MITKILAIGIVVVLAAVLLVAGFLPPATNKNAVPGTAGQEQTAAATLNQSSRGSTQEQAENDDADDSQTSPSVEAKMVNPPVPIRIFEIHGRVTDSNNQPIEGVLIADEIKHGSTRSNQDGSYQISLQRPEFKTPVLNFLRSGYRENRVGIAIHNTPAKSRYEINVTLQAATNSTSVHGWVGNQLGEGLAGRKIAIRAQAGQAAGIKFYTVISDDNGNFSFEGVRSGVSYKLTIEPDAAYAGYTLEPFPVSLHTPPATIILERLRLVDIEGLIVGVDNSPVANFSINVQNLSLDYPDRRITSDSSGFFALRGFPAGELKLSTDSAEYFKITGLWLRVDDYRNLMLSIDKGSYLLSGWVSDEHDAPIAKARVTLDAKFSIDGYQSHSHRSRVTDSSGRFQFAGLGDVAHEVTVYVRDHSVHTVQHRFSSFSDSLEIRLGR